MADISIKNLTKSYGSLQVIHGLSLDIKDGEFLILVGPSGCGKSTLLRMIAGLETINSGEIALGSKVINKLPPRQRDIAMVFQSYALYPHMTVRKNMGFSLKLAGASKSDIESKVLDAAKVLDLESLLDRKPSALSGGQRQRVAMGRAITRDPALFLFDEPLSNLDAKLRVQMRSEIVELHDRLKTTTVYVTHDQVEAMTMADRIVVMNSGHIEQVGTPMELYNTPDSLFVATFIGSPAMNLLRGTLSSSGKFQSQDGLAFNLQDAIVESGVQINNEESSDIVIGFRPEHTRMDNRGLALCSTNVKLAEPTGSETLLSTVVNNETIMVLDRERRIMEKGQNVELSVQASDLHFFDAASGARLN